MMSKPYIFYIDGVGCAACTNGIEHSLRSNSTVPIEYVHIDLTTATDPKKAIVILSAHDEDHYAMWNQLKSHIESASFECQPYDYEEAQTSVDTSEVKKPDLFASIKKISSSHWFLGGLGCGTGLALLVTFLIAGSIPLTLMLPLAGLSTLLTLALGAHSYTDAWKKLIKAKTLTMDSLFAISTITVLLVSIAAFFIPWLPMMFEAGLLIYGFRHIGLAIEETLKEKIHPGQFRDRAPKTVRLILESGIYEMPLSSIKPDDIIEIHPGELIPLDGFCAEAALIYNTITSGLPLPRHYHPEEKILAGMRLSDNTKPLKMRILHNVHNSYLAKIDALIAQFVHNKIPLESTTQPLLDYFIPSVIVLALLSGLIIGHFYPAAIAIQCAVSVLVSACPCTLGLIIPLAVKTGIHKGTEHGVHFKSSQAIQELEQIDTIIFDLNGTLNTGIPSVKSYTAQPDSPQFFDICATLEAESPHPIGQVIAAFSKTHQGTVTPINRLNNSHHSGVSGEINGQKYFIGGRGLMNEHGIATADVEQQLSLDAGDSLIYVAQGKKLLGHFIITDPLRKDALKTINTLKKMGKEIHICTGADEQTAQRYATALGIQYVEANSTATHSERTGKSKPEYINSLKMQKKKVAMIGDAANDASALAASDLGIAILSINSDLQTQEHADAIIKSDTLMPIANAFAVAQQTEQNINQNLLMSLAYNLGSIFISGGLLVAAGLTIHPAVGAALMAVQACIILLNVYHFKHKPLAHLANHKELEPPIVSPANIIKENQTMQPSAKRVPDSKAAHHFAPLFQKAQSSVSEGLPQQNIALSPRMT